MGKHDNNYISRFQQRERTLRIRLTICLFMLFISIPCLYLGIEYDSPWLREVPSAFVYISTIGLFTSIFIYTFPLEQS